MDVGGRPFGRQMRVSSIYFTSPKLSLLLSFGSEARVRNFLPSPTEGALVDYFQGHSQWNIVCASSAAIASSFARQSVQVLIVCLFESAGRRAFLGKLDGNIISQIKSEVG